MKHPTHETDGKVTGNSPLNLLRLYLKLTIPEEGCLYQKLAIQYY